MTVVTPWSCLRLCIFCTLGRVYLQLVCHLSCFLIIMVLATNPNPYRDLVGWDLQQEHLDQLDLQQVQFPKDSVQLRQHSPNY